MVDVPGWRVTVSFVVVLVVAVVDGRGRIVVIGGGGVISVVGGRGNKVVPGGTGPGGTGPGGTGPGGTGPGGTGPGGTGPGRPGGTGPGRPGGTGQEPHTRMKVKKYKYWTDFYHSQKFYHCYLTMIFKETNLDHKLPAGWFLIPDL